MAQLVSGVCVVTAQARDHTPCGLAATSVCAYSANPPTVLVCVGRNGRARAAISSARAFGMHILSVEQESLARRFATPGTERFAALDWEWDGDVPALALAGVVVYLRCARVAVKSHGDHAIVIGEVERIASAPREPLIYRQRRMDWRLERA
jgi:flavin reductase (DIM6/NTAB) family NADH-FMN oxidoreductase RutF